MFLNHSAAFTSFEPVTTDMDAPQKRMPIPAMIAGTMVETETGWTPVERLSLGDAVYTLEGGPAPIADLRQIRLSAGTQLWHVPGGALGNCDDLLLTRDQHVMITDNDAEAMFDTPYVLIPAPALQGFRGTRRIDCVPGAIAVEMTFDAEEIVYANSGTLMHCAAMSGLSDGFFRTLSTAEARIFLAMQNTNDAVLMAA